ncbi:glycoside hydrolase family 3 N-terminal domain-containing protein [Nafulsella turpanensis]|uniref:glycoside hydrolase family 3 N-terminal domain-containing protein n=1 Tax=Nafulsella turpanensis TaxID=1265690 RepID=UPI000349FF69|nr:glycoside hydrolase family 3 N-terminal domain-containing protein [Nafulsella turpanensis]
MMNRKFLFTALASCSLFACSAQTPENIKEVVKSPASDAVNQYTLSDYYRDNQTLEVRVNEIFNNMRDEQRVGQMIVPAVGRLGKPDAEVEELIKKNWIGGVLLLNGSKESFKNYIARFDSLSKSNGGLPLIYSADAEPSLINRKIEGTPTIVKTSQIQDSASAAQVARQINQELKDIGILYNYAPVVDLSLQNQAIGNRSFGSDPEKVTALANAFIQATQEEGIVATAKHFPGHGLVKGDSHHKLVFIDGEMKEAPLYQDLIEQGVLSIMVGHIAVENNPAYNTNGQPATLSRKIVTELLKEQMGFEGIITTDAMNMGAVASIPNAGLEAVKAGNDMILMPLDEKKLVYGILEEMNNNEAFREQVYDSVKKIIRMKLTAGVME